MKLKTLVSTAWTWVVRNRKWFYRGFAVLLLVGVAMAVLRDCSRESLYDSLFDEYSQSIKQHQKQLEELRRIQETERRAREVEDRRFLEEIARIDARYQAGLGMVEEVRSGTQRQIIREHEEDPQSLVRRFEETFGIPVDRSPTGMVDL